jgi:hypothetical protein
MPRSERLDLRVTAAEKALWDAAAVHAGLSLSEFVRRRVNEGITAPSERPPRATTGPSAEPSLAAPPARNSRPCLCARCARIGLPACPACRQAVLDALKT